MQGLIWAIYYLHRGSVRNSKKWPKNIELTVVWRVLSVTQSHNRKATDTENTVRHTVTQLCWLNDRIIVLTQGGTEKGRQSLVKKQ